MVSQPPTNSNRPRLLIVNRNPQETAHGDNEELLVKCYTSNDYDHAIERIKRREDQPISGIVTNLYIPSIRELNQHREHFSQLYHEWYTEKDSTSDNATSTGHKTDSEDLRAQELGDRIEQIQRGINLPLGVFLAKHALERNIPTTIVTSLVRGDYELDIVSQLVNCPIVYCENPLRIKIPWNKGVAEVSSPNYVGQFH